MKHNTLSRRRAPRSRSRSVNTLSAAQLERKRANDRKAQRTIREQTKEHIRYLERQVAQLGTREAQLKYVMQRNAALETELALLKQQMNPVSYIFGTKDVADSYKPMALVPTGYSNWRPLGASTTLYMTDSPYLPASTAVSIAEQYPTPESTLATAYFPYMETRLATDPSTSQTWPHKPTPSSTLRKSGMPCDPGCNDESSLYTTECVDQRANHQRSSNHDCQHRKLGCIA